MNRSQFGGLCAVVIFVLVVRLLRTPREEPVPPQRAQVVSTAFRPATGSGWNLVREPGVSDRTLADQLLGYWQGETIDGVTTSFRFDATGAFACSVGRDDPGRGYVVHGGAAGEWRVERARLHVRWITADTPASQALICRTAQTAVRFDGAEWVRLSGVEGDPTERLYRRAH